MSVRVWQLAAFAYVLVLMLVALEVPLNLNLSRRVDAEVRAEAANQAQLVAASAAGQLTDPTKLTPLVRTADDAVGGRVIIVDAQGRLLADSAGSGLTSASYANRPEIQQALAGNVEQGERHSASLGQDLLFTAVPIVEGNRRTGAVRITQSVDAVKSEVRRDTLALIGLGLAALALGLIVAWLLAGYLSRPLRGLTAAARRVEAGDLDARARGGGRPRAPRGRPRLQRHDRPPEPLDGRAAGLRRQRRPPAPHAAHRPAPAARGRGPQDRERRAAPRPRGGRARGRAPRAHRDGPAHARARGPAADRGRAARTHRGGRGGARALGLGRRRARRRPAAPGPQRRRPGRRVGRGRRGHPRQPRRERDRAHRAADGGRRRARRGPRPRHHRRPRRRAGPRAGRGGARLRALRPRQLARRAPARQRPRPHDRARRSPSDGAGRRRSPTGPRAAPAPWSGCRWPAADAARPGRDAPPDPDRVVTTVMEDR